MEFLEVKDMCRAFGGLRAVDGVSFSVSHNEIKAVIGPNGAGKTTLFNLIAGALVPDSGEVRIGGSPIHGLPPYRIARHGIARTFQNIKLFPGMTVLENVMVGMHMHGGAGFLSSMLHLPGSRREEREIRARALEVLEFTGIADLADQDAVSLAFGRQRVVEIARALAARPALLLLDEPAAGLNMHETDQVARVIVKIREGGVTVLVIEHDMSLVMNISDSIVVLSSGKKIAEGAPHDIQKNSEVVRVYLGEDDA
ncbi:MAG: ABC transporter ATP-binding protein [Spirochaetes bacterium]|nr:MAG: ABC transporter ATP-binding protein [Spirochaetota bacterium]